MTCAKDKTKEKNMYVRVLLVLSFALILGGCAMGQKTNYSDDHIVFNGNANTTGPVCM